MSTFEKMLQEMTGILKKGIFWFILVCCLKKLYGMQLILILTF